MVLEKLTTGEIVQRLVINHAARDEVGDPAEPEGTGGTPRDLRLHTQDGARRSLRPQRGHVSAFQAQPEASHPLQAETWPCPMCWSALDHQGVLVVAVLDLGSTISLAWHFVLLVMYAGRYKTCSRI